MNIYAASEENRRTVLRIVALLLALADMCEGLCDRSPALRELVLLVLRPGEAVVRAYLARYMYDPMYEPLASPFGQTAQIVRLDSDSRHEAMRLARSFRLLAAMVAELAEALVEWPELLPRHAGPDMSCLAVTLAAVGHRFLRRDDS